MLLREAMDEGRHELKVQLYSTDLDDEAIATARAGLYPPNIAQDVTAERLHRFFTRDQGEHGGYKVKKDIRDRVVFAEMHQHRATRFLGDVGCDLRRVVAHGAGDAVEFLVVVEARRPHRLDDRRPRHGRRARLRRRRSRHAREPRPPRAACRDLGGQARAGRASGGRRHRDCPKPCLWPSARACNDLGGIVCPTHLR